MFHYFLIELDPSHLLETQLSGISIDGDEFLEYLESIQKQEPQEHEQSLPPQQSTFIEHYDPTNFSQFQPSMFSIFPIKLNTLRIFQ